MVRGMEITQLQGWDKYLGFPHPRIVLLMCTGIKMCVHLPQSLPNIVLLFPTRFTHSRPRNLLQHKYISSHQQFYTISHLGFWLRASPPSTTFGSEIQLHPFFHSVSYKTAWFFTLRTQIRFQEDHNMAYCSCTAWKQLFNLSHYYIS